MVGLLVLEPTLSLLRVLDDLRVLCDRCSDRLALSTRPEFEERGKFSHKVMMTVFVLK